MCLKGPLGHLMREKISWKTKPLAQPLLLGVGSRVSTCKWWDSQKCCGKKSPCVLPLLSKSISPTSNCAPLCGKGHARLTNTPAGSEILGESLLVEWWRQCWPWKVHSPWGKGTSKAKRNGNSRAGTQLVLPSLAHGCCCRTKTLTSSLPADLWCS